MNVMVTLYKDQMVVSSLEVAEHFEKEHYNVLQSIDSLIGNKKGSGKDDLKIQAISTLQEDDFKNRLISETCENEMQNEISQMFFKTTYKDSMNRRKPMYLMNRDGFSLLVMGFTGTKALNWKLQYIKAFNAMEEQLRTLAITKGIRRELTDAIKEFIPETPNKKYLYKHYTDLAYKKSFGKNAKQLREIIGIANGENVRPALTADGKEIVAKKEKLISALIENGVEYQQVKSTVPDEHANVSGYIDEYAVLKLIQ